MKKLLLLPLFTVICSTVFACGSYIPHDSPWSFGIILANRSYQPQTGSKMYLFPGLTARYQGQQLTYRAAIEYNRFFVDAPQNGDMPDYLYIEGSGQTGLFRLGVEKTFFKNYRINPIAAIDIASTHTRSLFSYEGGMMGLYETRYTKSNSIGVFPSVGCEFHLSKHLSISAESRMRLNRTSEKTIASNQHTGDRSEQKQSNYSSKLDLPATVTFHINL
jgi:hypothetical protein